jgi:hypothetical protein
VDNDHIRPWDSDPEWVWKNFMRGNQFILMDHYMDFRMNSPDTPDPKHNPTRKAMGLARKLADRVDLVSLAPQGDLATTRYCLANPDREYLVYRSASESGEFSVTLRPSTYSVEWINTSSGRNVYSQDYRANAGENTFVTPFDGPSILHLQKK